MATDRYRGKELVKVLAVIGVINGIAPVAAPVLGGVLTDAVGWRGIFVILLAIGVILLGGSMLFRESLPPRRRAGQSLLRTFGNFGTILRNKHFILYVLQLGFAQGILFSNIASSPFIIQEHYGFSALEFSIVFAVNSLAFMAAAPTLASLPPPAGRHHGELHRDVRALRRRTRSPVVRMRFLGI